jgi:uncharacterized SAM-binding protein YcdF (DUF218 family)
MLRLGIRILARIMILLGCLVVLVTVAPPRWYIAWLAGPWENPQEGVLIVPAADGVNEDMLGQGSYWRSVYAVWAWRDGKFRNVVLSGDRSMTWPMRNFLVCQGVPAEAVRIEDKSLNTRENASFTASLVRDLPGPYVLLTSDYHMWRAHRAFTRAGLQVTPRPLPDAGKRITQWTARWQVFLDLLVETAKIGYYRARGWV